MNSLVKKCVCVFLLSVPCLFGCNKGNNEPPKEDPNEFEWVIYPDDTKEKTEEEMFIFPIKDGAELSILSPEWMSYYYDCKNYMNISLYYAAGKERTAPKSPSLRWDFSEECDSFTLLVSTSKEMTEPVSYQVDKKTQQLDNLFAGTTYYYQLKANLEDKVVLSKRMSFKTIDFFRTISLDGVFNARDLGNKKTVDGKRVKQGLVYRTANFDGVTSLGQEQAKEFGIKVDLDLREQGPTSSPLGEDVRYINNGFGKYGSPLYYSSLNGVNVSSYQKPMRDNLKVFVDPSNYPLAFHCAVGRDRTGTLAITLLLLLGVEVEQIKQDYVVSFFSKACNTENLKSYNNLMVDLLDYYDYYRAKDGTYAEDIYQGVEKYCLDIGLTQEDIVSIRSNLLA